MNNAISGRPYGPYTVKSANPLSADWTGPNTCEPSVHLIFRGGIIARDRVIDIVMHREWHCFICSIHWAWWSINQMFHFIMPAGFKNVQKSVQVAFEVGVWIGKWISNPGLGSEVDNVLKRWFFEQAVDRFFYQWYRALKSESSVLFRMFNRASFQAYHLIVIVQIIDSRNCVSETAKFPGKVELW